MAEAAFSAIYVFNVWKFVLKYNKFFIYFTCRVFFLKKKKKSSFCSAKVPGELGLFPFLLLWQRNFTAVPKSLQNSHIHALN